MDDMCSIVFLSKVDRMFKMLLLRIHRLQDSNLDRFSINQWVKAYITTKCTNNGFRTQLPLINPGEIILKLEMRSQMLMQSWINFHPEALLQLLL